MILKKIGSRMAAVLAVISMGVFGFQAPALAVGVEMNGPNGTSGYYAVDYAQDRIVILVRSGFLLSGQCATAYLDISRVAGVGKSGTHYDARAARTCKSYDSKTSSWQYEGGTYGIQIDGVLKAGVCHGNLNTMGTCDNKVGSVSSINPVSDSNNMCTRFWSENASGTQFYFGAGDPGSCSS